MDSKLNHSRVRWGVVAAAAGALLLLPGCSASQLERGYLPADSQGATDQTARITDLWVGSWIAALILGVLVWGLILWAVVAYRRRREDDPLPSQFRYHVPIEIMYTAVPTIVVLVLFYFTARDQAAIVGLDADTEPDLTVQVVGKQWAWDFNYLEENVYSTGTQANYDAGGDVDGRLATLYLPVDRTVEFDLLTRDVNHSFWVPAWLFKMDLVAGRENTFRVTPTEIGSFEGRCAELCGEYHAEMLFNVEVLSQEDFDAQMDRLAEAGQTGALEPDLGRSPIVDGLDGGGIRGTGDDQSGIQEPTGDEEGDAAASGDAAPEHRENA